MEYLLERLTVFDLVYQGLVVAIVGLQLPGLKTWQWLLLYIYLLASLVNPLLVTHPSPSSIS